MSAGYGSVTLRRHAGRLIRTHPAYTARTEVFVTIPSPISGIVSIAKFSVLHDATGIRGTRPRGSEERRSIQFGFEGIIGLQFWRIHNFYSNRIDVHKHLARRNSVYFFLVILHWVAESLAFSAGTHISILCSFLERAYIGLELRDGPKLRITQL